MPFPCSFIVLHVVGNLHSFKGPTRRLQRVRLFLCSLYCTCLGFPGEHRRGICAVECVAAHLRGFEEDSRSEVVFWIDEWSIEFGFTDDYQKYGKRIFLDEPGLLPKLSCMLLGFLLFVMMLVLFVAGWVLPITFCVIIAILTMVNMT